MATDDVAPLLYAVLGAGGTGGLAVIVNAYRSWRKGRIEDEGTLLQRLNDDNIAQRARADRAEADRDNAIQARNAWMNQATVYEVQLVRAQLRPRKVILPEFDLAGEEESEQG